MRRLYQSFTLAFAMYSQIPMPRVEWGEGAMSYVFCFFPLIGVVLGGCQLLWFACADLLRLGGLLLAAGSILISLAITGGIHLDGFCDTCDALGSHQPRERKLEILKDSHIGAFALIGYCAYFLLTAALWAEVNLSPTAALALALIPVLSRTLSGICSITMKNARGTGLLATFSDASAKRMVGVTLAVWLLLVSVGLLLISPIYGFAVLLGAGIALLWFQRMSRKQFGGITGDLAGWFLQMCELLCVAAVVLAEKLEVLL